MCIRDSCWEGEPPPGQEAEIIEIGVCVLDVLTGERLARESILVRPERSQVSAFCTQLTTLTPERVARGVTFERACRILRRKYGAGDRAWASYGDEDRRLFEKQCAARGAPYPFGPTHLNAVSYTHLRAHETVLDTVCRLLLEKQNQYIDLPY